MKILCVIPARLKSTRLPRKMLQNVQGQAMIQKTYLNAKACQDIDRFIVATDSDEIAHVLHEIDAEIMMTPENLKTGSDRVAFVAKQLPEYDVVINLQGDEPFIRASMLSQLVQPYKMGENPEMATLAYALKSADYQNPNIVKVILDQKSDAVYFSRAAIPYFRERVDVPVYHHMGLYAYQREFLLKYTTFKQTPLEQAELLEQLRAIENGHKIRVVITTERSLEINTPEELEQAQSYR